MDPEMRNWQAVCGTEGCENHGVPLVVPAQVVGPVVVCGPCGVQIQDLQEAQ